MADAGASMTLATISLIGFALLAGFYLTTLNALWTLVSVTVTAVLVSQLLRKLRRRDALTERRVCVLVLGDIGRSPRMQYHALSLSKHGYSVTFVGFPGTKPHQDVIGDERITIIPITELKGLQVGPRMVSYVTKVILQSLQLLLVLLKTDVQSHIIMQNPPGLPSIVVTWLVCGLRGSRFIIDWHNYGYTIMALSHGPDHPIVRLAQWYEQLFGRFSSHNLCVTNAMKEDLQNNWNISMTTLYDKPPAIFKETSVDQKHQLFMRLAIRLFLSNPGLTCHNPCVCYSGERPDGETERTAFTCRDPSDLSVTLTSGRPALLISSTSWTEDEDFSILLKALEDYEGFVKAGASLPSLVCVITGNYSVDSVLLVCVITGNYSVDSVLQVCVITGNYSVDSVLLVCVITGNYSVDSVLQVFMVQVTIVLTVYCRSVSLQVTIVLTVYCWSVSLQVTIVLTVYCWSVWSQVTIVLTVYCMSVSLQVTIVLTVYCRSVSLQVTIVLTVYCWSVSLQVTIVLTVYCWSVSLQVTIVLTVYCRSVSLQVTIVLTVYCRSVSLQVTIVLTVYCWSVWSQVTIVLTVYCRSVSLQVTIVLTVYCRSVWSQVTIVLTVYCRSVSLQVTIVLTVYCRSVSSQVTIVLTVYCRSVSLQVTIVLTVYCRSLRFEHVRICTPWLEAEDYPVLLGSADLGVCLHKSSSGLDLPMKVVDMFGCCLPVCAIHFYCLHELVKHEENGLIFKDSEELSGQLKALLWDFPDCEDEGKLGQFRRNLRASGGQRWDQNWDQNVLPLLTAP
ncbi:chitobiosyldiphosphodolichol beta-mannosyltransferase-like [Oncorhynchus keta]|uniref:chitobiosyldiphosphodolichol beta-mannosyltransferase-like n=1 Tax=Oncorhynchus keta TaxID=8018 RepID=UPI00227C7E3D|nr:chitobiosyldiphosphodolichol beta-mannosyltransferase-like [Oncorhynchus keta]